MQKKFTVTLPIELANRIESESKAKDISKSRHVLRLLEKAYGLDRKEKEKEKKTA